MNSETQFSLDVGIVGAGPAGSILARGLAERGVRVLLVDRPIGPAHGRGELLAPSIAHRISAQQLLHENWRTPHKEVFEFLSSWGSEHQIERNYVFDPYGNALALDRPKFDSQLKLEAVRHGAELVRGKVRVADRCEEGWRLEVARRGQIFVAGCRYLVLANGRRGRHLNLPFWRTAIDSLVCIGYVFRGYQGDTRPSVESYDWGWSYSVGLPTGSLMVCLFTDADILSREMPRRRDLVLQQHAPHSRILRSRLRSVYGQGGAAETFTVSASPALARPICGRRWCLLGDAAQSYDPLSSMGITQAVDCAQRLADALIGHGDLSASAQGAYLEFCDGIFDTFMAGRWTFYSLEGRWPDRPFWERRRRPPRGVPVQ